MHGILYDKDKRVRLYNQGTPVVNSNLQSAYAKYLNLIGDRFTAIPNGDKYDIGLKYADKIIPYEDNVAKGTIPGYINYNGTHFDVSPIATDKYTVSNPAYGKAFVNALTTPRKLNFIGATVVDDPANDEADITVSDTKTAVFNNDVQVGTTGRRVNFLGGSHTITEDITNDQFDIDLGYIPNPKGKKAGWAYGGQFDFNAPFGGGLLNLPYTATSGSVTGINSNTHGHARRYQSGPDDDDTIECSPDFSMTQLSYNPKLSGKFSLNTLNDARVMIGFCDASIPSGNNVYLDNLSGFLLGYQYDVAETEDTHWQIIRNDGDATQDKVATAIALTDTTPFTFDIVGEATPTPRWGWSINGGAFTYYTTEIPAINTNLRFIFRIEQIGGNDSILDMYYLYLLQDR